jgi:hypothetical protein
MASGFKVLHPMSVGYFIIRFKALQPFIDDSCREIKKAFEPAKAFL